jgi:hypothetical protein
MNIVLVVYGTYIILEKANRTTFYRLSPTCRYGGLWATSKDRIPPLGGYPPPGGGGGGGGARPPGGGGESPPGGANPEGGPFWVKLGLERGGPSGWRRLATCA